MSNMEIYNLEGKSRYYLDIPYGSGEYYSICPVCSHLRKNKNQKNRCLSWNRNKEVGYCHHCGARFVKFKPFSSLQGHSPKLIGLPPVKQEYIKTNKYSNWIASPSARNDVGDSSTTKQLNPSTTKPSNSSTPNPSTLQINLIKQSWGLESNFGTFLKSNFDDEVLDQIMKDYFLGMTNEKSVIYWYIDKNYRLRSGKIMQYDALTGKRIKHPSTTKQLNPSTLNHPTWVHSILKKKGELDNDWQFNRCLFGEHLLRKYPDRNVILVEGEKTAVICSAYFPNKVCLATGGSNMLSGEVCEPLRNRKVIVVPDSDMVADWSEKVNSINKERNLNLRLYTKLNELFTKEQIEMKWDLADYCLNNHNDLKENN